MYEGNKALDLDRDRTFAYAWQGHEIGISGRAYSYLVCMMLLDILTLQAFCGLTTRSNYKTTKEFK